MDAVAKEVRGLTRAGNIVKKVLLVSNLLVMLFSLVMIGVGGAAIGQQFSALTSTTLASGIVVIGVLLLIISFIGCWGAFKENRKLLIAYFALILFFVLVEFSVGIAAYVKRGELSFYASESWTFFYTNDRKVINDLENQFKCCGYYENTDRAVPPMGNEPTCATAFYPNEGACSADINNKINDYFVSNSTYGWIVASNIQNVEHCCGWISTNETGAASAFGRVSDSDPTQCIVAQPTWTSPCFSKIGANWNANYNYRNTTGEDWILAYENSFRCCGWQSMTSQQIPPYHNNTCVITKGYEQSCEPVMTDALVQALGAVGGVCIAIAILQLFTLAITIYLIRAMPKNKANDMPEPQEMVDEE